MVIFGVHPAGLDGVGSHWTASPFPSAVTTSSAIVPPRMGQDDLLTLPQLPPVCLSILWFLLHYLRGSIPSGGSCPARGETDARLITVGELDAGLLECLAYRRDGPLLQLLSALKSQHGVDRHLRRRGKVPNTQTQGPAGHPTLDRGKNHDIIMILL